MSPRRLTGLARIGRDLAALLSTRPEFRVGYLGRGGVGRRKFPWAQYSYPEQGQWGEDYLPMVWNDFRDGERGIVMSLWDASRMLWFGQPAGLQGYPELQKFLGEGRTFEKWGYFPVDGEGPVDQQLPLGMQAAIAGYDRTLCASEWGSMVTSDGNQGSWLPHGIFASTFHPSEHSKSVRELLNWDRHAAIIGCNMANQARKDFPVAFETAALLRQEYGNSFKFWLHTDTLLRYWDVRALATDYGVGDCLEVTMELTDAQLAQRYSACDVTMLPSAGEGFGYPIAESVACGTACVVTGYAAGQELVPEDWRVSPMAYRIDTAHNVRRAVLSAWGFAGKCKQEIEKKQVDWEGRGGEVTSLVAHLDWSKLQHEWVKWFLAGVTNGKDAR